MLTLFHSVNTRSFRCLWALEALRLPYTLEIMPFPPRAKFPKYLELNPLGTVPFLLTDDVRMSESSAILQYLATAFGSNELAVEPNDQDYAAWLNWLHFGEATLTFPLALVLRYSRFEIEQRRQPQVVADYSLWFQNRLKAIDRALADRDWLCANRFTVADISIGYALKLACSIGLEDTLSPRVMAYWQRLQLTRGYLSAMVAQGTPIQ